MELKDIIGKDYKTFNVGGNIYREFKCWQGIPAVFDGANVSVTPENFKKLLDVLKSYETLENIRNSIK